jgi:quinoprotein dehydrogenase-associated probable ABC transporter substrate-binding protein
MERSSQATSTRWINSSVRRTALAPILICILAVLPASMVLAQAPAVAKAPTLKVCADPDNLPQSDRAGAGYENKIAEALARDLGRKLEYTWFPQRMGFVRQTLRAQDDVTHEFKCDVIIGVPKGYDLTLTTQPYMRSIYALVAPEKAEYSNVKNPDDLLALPPEKLSRLRFGVFARTPPTDWLVKNGLINQARFYAPQSGDPSEHPANIIERAFAANEIDVAMVWGPVAGFIANRHTGNEALRAIPFKPDPTIQYDYEMTMGVRFGEKDWKDTLDKWIATHRDDIRTVLTTFRVPLLEPSAPK